MPNTLSNVTGDIRRIHADVPVPVAAEGVTLFLSSHESTMAQIDLAEVRVRRPLGRRVLSLAVLDRSGIAESTGREAPMVRLRIPLGGSAIIGRGRLDLPLLHSEIMSESHVTLSYLRTEAGDVLSIHDNDSANGSHLSEEGEASWEERRKVITTEAIDSASLGEGYNELHEYHPSDYEALFDGSRRYADTQEIRPESHASF